MAASRRAHTGFRLPRKEWLSRLNTLAADLEKQAQDDVHYRKRDPDDSVRRAAVVVGSLLRAMHDEDQVTLARLEAPARAHLRTKLDPLDFSPGISLVLERSDALYRVKEFLSISIGALRANFDRKSDATIKELARIGAETVDRILEDPEIARTLLVPSPKTPARAKASTLKPARPNEKRRGEIVTAIAAAVRRGLIAGRPSDYVAKGAIVTALNQLGMNAKDAFSR